MGPQCKREAQFAASAAGRARASQRPCRRGGGSERGRPQAEGRERARERGAKDLRTDRPVAFAAWRTRERLAGVVTANPDSYGENRRETGDRTHISLSKYRFQICDPPQIILHFSRKRICHFIKILRGFSYPRVFKTVALCVRVHVLITFILISMVSTGNEFSFFAKIPSTFVLKYKTLQRAPRLGR